MRIIKIIPLLAAMVMSVSSFAQDTVKDFSAKVAGSRVSFSYGYEMKADVLVKGSGTVYVQGEAFRVDVDGLEIICDSKTRWTLDRGAKEIVIESVDGVDLLDNPVLLVTSFDKAFREVSRGSAEVSGKKCLKVDFAPKTESGISALAMFFCKDELVCVQVRMKDGNTTVFDISDMKFAEPAEDGLFSYDADALDNSWVKTDLR
ncbi:MAG: outer membrane lipoprotein carrier protein LolA [Bacteroidales bacterium]|nr:outer membrane lipoprotein carrier protein LolA [Bacteroidales bacterium]